jgi:hypothetical protein
VSQSSNELDEPDPSVTPIVVKLLESAGAMLEADCAAAKAYLTRASALPLAAHSGSGRFTMVGGMISVRGFRLPRGALS